MRKLVVLTFVSLDGVMQAPGGPEEDPSENFIWGGWSVPYADKEMGDVMTEQMGQPFDMLLGRKTYDLFASYWPKHDEKTTPGADALNKAKHYVVSASLTDLTWENSELISGDVPAKIKELKQQDGPMLQVHGSGNLIQTLLQNDLVDELWLKIYPVTLGTGKRLFDEGITPTAYELISSKTTPSGVIIANYKSAGKPKTGSFV